MENIYKHNILPALLLFSSPNVAKTAAAKEADDCIKINAFQKRITDLHLYVYTKDARTAHTA